MITASGSRISARGRMAAREQHEAAARPPLAAVAQGVRLVGEHVEGAARASPSRTRRPTASRPRLARLDRHAQERAVGHAPERRRGVLGHGRDERRGERRLGGDDHVPGAHGAPGRARRTISSSPSGWSAVTHSPCARAGRAGAERGGQLAGAAEQVAGDQRPLAAPHEREEADPAARRQLGELGGRAVRGAREDLLDRGRQRAEELAERAVVLEREHARADLGGRVAAAGRRSRR